jgi:hypothetical protein
MLMGGRSFRGRTTSLGYGVDVKAEGEEEDASNHRTRKTRDPAAGLRQLASLQALVM